MEIKLTAEERAFDMENALEETEEGIKALKLYGVDMETIKEAFWIRTILKRAIYAEQELKRVQEYHRQEEQYRYDKLRGFEEPGY